MDTITTTIFYKLGEEQVKDRHTCRVDIPPESLISQIQQTILSPSHSQIMDVLSDGAYPLGQSAKRKFQGRTSSLHKIKSDILSILDESEMKKLETLFWNSKKGWARTSYLEDELRAFLKAKALEKKNRHKASVIMPQQTIPEVPTKRKSQAKISSTAIGRRESKVRNIRHMSIKEAGKPREILLRRKLTDAELEALNSEKEKERMHLLARDRIESFDEDTESYRGEESKISQVKKAEIETKRRKDGAEDKKTDKKSKPPRLMSRRLSHPPPEEDKRSKTSRAYSIDSSHDIKDMLRRDSKSTFKRGVVADDDEEAMTRALREQLKKIQPMDDDNQDQDDDDVEDKEEITYDGTRERRGKREKRAFETNDKLTKEERKRLREEERKSRRKKPHGSTSPSELDEWIKLQEMYKPEKKSFSSTLGRRYSKLSSSRPPSTKATDSTASGKDKSKYGLKGSRDKSKYGLKGSRDTSKYGLKGSRDKSKYGLKGSRDKSKYGLLGSRDKSKYGLKGSRDTSKYGLKGSRDKSKYGLKGSRDKSKYGLLGSRDKSKYGLKGSRDTSKYGLKGSRDKSKYGLKGSRDKSKYGLKGSRDKSKYVLKGSRDKSKYGLKGSRDKSKYGLKGSRDKSKYGLLGSRDKSKYGLKGSRDTSKYGLKGSRDKSKYGLKGSRDKSKYGLLGSRDKSKYGLKGSRDTSKYGLKGSRDKSKYGLKGSRDKSKYGLLGSRDKSKYGLKGSRDTSKYGLKGSRDKSKYGLKGSRDKSKYGLLGSRDKSKYGLLGSRDKSKYGLKGSNDKFIHSAASLIHTSQKSSIEEDQKTLVIRPQLSRSKWKWAATKVMAAMRGKQKEMELEQVGKLQMQAPTVVKAPVMQRVLSKLNTLFTRAKKEKKDAPWYARRWDDIGNQKSIYASGGVLPSGQTSEMTMQSSVTEASQEHKAATSPKQAVLDTTKLAQKIQVVLASDKKKTKHMRTDRKSTIMTSDMNLGDIISKSTKKSTDKRKQSVEKGSPMGFREDARRISRGKQADKSAKKPPPKSPISEVRDTIASPDVEPTDKRRLKAKFSDDQGLEDAKSDRSSVDQDSEFDLTKLVWFRDDDDESVEEVLKESDVKQEAALKVDTTEKAEERVIHKTQPDAASKKKLHGRRTSSQQSFAPRTEKGAVPAKEVTAKEGAGKKTTGRQDRRREVERARRIDSVQVDEEEARGTALAAYAADSGEELTYKDRDLRRGVDFDDRSALKFYESEPDVTRVSRRIAVSPETISEMQIKREELDVEEFDGKKVRKSRDDVLDDRQVKVIKEVISKLEKHILKSGGKLTYEAIGGASPGSPLSPEGTSSLGEGADERQYSPSDKRSPRLKRRMTSDELRGPKRDVKHRASDVDHVRSTRKRSAKEEGEVSDAEKYARAMRERRHEREASAPKDRSTIRTRDSEELDKSRPKPSGYLDSEDDFREDVISTESIDRERREEDRKKRKTYLERAESGEDIRTDERRESVESLDRERQYGSRKIRDKEEVRKRRKDYLEREGSEEDIRADENVEELDRERKQRPAKVRDKEETSLRRKEHSRRVSSKEDIKRDERYESDESIDRERRRGSKKERDNDETRKRRKEHTGGVDSEEDIRRGDRYLRDRAKRTSRHTLDDRLDSKESFDRARDGAARRLTDRLSDRSSRDSFVERSDSIESFDRAQYLESRRSRDRLSATSLESLGERQRRRSLGIGGAELPIISTSVEREPMPGSSREGVEDKEERRAADRSKDPHAALGVDSTFAERKRSIRTLRRDGSSGQIKQKTEPEEEKAVAKETPRQHDRESGKPGRKGSRDALDRHVAGPASELPVEQGKAMRKRSLRSLDVEERRSPIRKTEKEGWAEEKISRRRDSGRDVAFGSKTHIAAAGEEKEWRQRDDGERAAPEADRTTRAAAERSDAARDDRRRPRETTYRETDRPRDKRHDTALARQIERLGESPFRDKHPSIIDMGDEEAPWKGREAEKAERRRRQKERLERSNSVATAERDLSRPLRSKSSISVIPKPPRVKDKSRLPLVGDDEETEARAHREKARRARRVVESETPSSTTRTSSTRGSSVPSKRGQVETPTYSSSESSSSSSYSGSREAFRRSKKHKYDELEVIDHFPDIEPEDYELDDGGSLKKMKLLKSPRISDSIISFVSEGQYEYPADWSGTSTTVVTPDFNLEEYRQSQGFPRILKKPLRKRDLEERFRERLARQRSLRTSLPSLMERPVPLQPRLEKAFSGWDIGSKTKSHHLDHLPAIAETAPQLIKTYTPKKLREYRHDSVRRIHHPIINPEQEGVSYVSKFGIEELFEFMVCTLVLSKPENPLDFLIDLTRTIKREMKVRFQVAKVMMTDSPHESPGTPKSFSSSSSSTPIHRDGTRTWSASSSP
ncbi:hypothetical protein Btru_047705 [Bulinus truncatus]|nr:hypothetical protein Btru_047705 [Bulinus truncatus]